MSKGKINGVSFTNLTGHSVKEIFSGMEIGPAKKEDILRVEMLSPQVKSIGDIKLFATIFEIESIPKKIENNFYIVSQKVADAIALKHPDRHDFVCTARIEHKQEKVDLLSPNGTPILDKNGYRIKVERSVIVGTHGFSFSKFLKVDELLGDKK